MFRRRVDISCGWVSVTGSSYNMLFSCTLYNTLREHFLIKQQHILNTAFDNYDYWLNILFTTENKASIRTTARYISQCFLLRDAASSN